MSELDPTLRTRIGEEAARAGEVIPPPLAELERRAATRRHRRWGGWGLGVAAAAAVAIAAVTLWPGGSGRLPFAAGPALPPGAWEFTVPTYEGSGAGMDALITGRLGFTEAGCTLIYQPGDPGSVRPVVFPDAVGVSFSNGVRAVVHERTGRVFAVEGQEFSYGGGWVPAGRTWTQGCGQWRADVAWINDDPADGPLTGDPAPPEQPAPTRLATEAEMGWYDVPTFAWDPAQGGDAALLEGTVSMTADGCAVVEVEDRQQTVGLVLPDAQGMRQDSRPMIFSTFPGGGQTMMAQEGLTVSYGGGFTQTAEFTTQWQRLCPRSPVDALFLVQDQMP